MSIVIVTDPLKAKLAAADMPLELCSAEGTLLGYFTPAKAREYKLQPPASEEELQDRFARGGGRSLKDILADLEKRA